MAQSTSGVLPLPTTSSSSASSATTSPTTSTTPTTTAAATTSTNASTASSSSSTSSASTSSSSSASATSSSTSTTPTLAASPTGATSAVVQTYTSTVLATPTVTSTPQSDTTSSNSFFDNKGAVAGVFSVVGVIVVALIIALITNAVRRRRAQKFDRDVAEAAAEAAMSSRSPFDDYGYGNGGGGGGGGNGGGGGGGGYGYSDNSHGTYQLPPLNPHADPYAMSEMSQYDPYAAGAASLAAASAVGRSRSRKESETGAPGIAGVGAGPLVREPSKRAPYHAFAGPAPQQPDLQRGNGTLRGIRSTNQDVLEAAGLAGLAGAVPNNTNTNNTNGGGAYVTRRPSDTTQNTHFSGRSQFGSMSGHPAVPTPLQPGYPVDPYYNNAQRHDAHSPDPFAPYVPVTVTSSQPLPNPHEPSPSLPEHNDEDQDEYDAGSPTALRSDEQRMSYQDDADYSQGNRVLRVANE